MGVGDKLDKISEGMASLQAAVHDLEPLIKLFRDHRDPLLELIEKGEKLLRQVEDAKVMDMIGYGKELFAKAKEIDLINLLDKMATISSFGKDMENLEVSPTADFSEVNILGGNKSV